jgi:hypothetical protein
VLAPLLAPLLARVVLWQVALVHSQRIELAGFVVDATVAVVVVVVGRVGSSYSELEKLQKRVAMS